MQEIHSEDGFSLVELLMVMLLLTLILGAIIGVLTTSRTHASRDIERQDALAEARSSLRRMVIELRQASMLVDGSPNTIDVILRPRAGKVRRRVVYNCGYDPTTLRTNSSTGQNVPVTSCQRLATTGCTNAILCPDPQAVGSTPSTSTVATRLMNGPVTAWGTGVTTCTNPGHPPVFPYYAQFRATATSPITLRKICTATPGATATLADGATLSSARANDVFSAVVTFQLPERGERRRGVGPASVTGTPGSETTIFLQDGVQFRNRGNE